MTVSMSLSITVHASTSVPVPMFVYACVSLFVTTKRMSVPLCLCVSSLCYQNKICDSVLCMSVSVQVCDCAYCAISVFQYAPYLFARMRVPNLSDAEVMIDKKATDSDDKGYHGDPGVKNILEPDRRDVWKFVKYFHTDLERETGDTT